MWEYYPDTLYHIVLSTISTFRPNQEIGGCDFFCLCDNFCLQKVRPPPFLLFFPSHLLEVLPDSRAQCNFEHIIFFRGLFAPKKIPNDQDDEWFLYTNLWLYLIPVVWFLERDILESCRLPPTLESWQVK